MKHNHKEIIAQLLRCHPAPLLSIRLDILADIKYAVANAVIKTCKKRPRYWIYRTTLRKTNHKNTTKLPDYIQEHFSIRNVPENATVISQVPIEEGRRECSGKGTVIEAKVEKIQ